MMKIVSQELPSVFRGGRVTLATHLQAVERRVSERERRSAQYIPIRFIFRNKITQADRLLIGFDALILSKLFRYNKNFGKIIRGNNYEVIKVKTNVLLAKVRKRIEKIVTLLEVPFSTALILNRNCVECEFKSECYQRAIEVDDLSLLQGMPSKEREMNHKKGIFTVNQLSYTFRPRRRSKWFKPKREKFHYSLKALAIREKKIYVVGNPELKIDGTPICLDVEALPDQGFYYLIGARIRNNNSTIQHSLWADNINDEEVIWREFVNILLSVKNPILIHYGNFETVFLKNMTKRYGTPPEGSAAANAIRSAINLLSVIFGRVYFPLIQMASKRFRDFLVSNGRSQM